MSSTSSSSRICWSHHDLDLILNLVYLHLSTELSGNVRTLRTFLQILRRFVWSLRTFLRSLRTLLQLKEFDHLLQPSFDLLLLCGFTSSMDSLLIAITKYPSPALLTKSCSTRKPLKASYYTKYKFCSNFT